MLLKVTRVFDRRAIRLYATVSNTPTFEEFKPLNLRSSKHQSKFQRKPRQTAVYEPRAREMPVDQDWPSVWPGQKTFHPAAVPIPIRQGYNDKGAPPSKYGNLELMKIPNFLHLTPPAIQRHCEALKQFCTKWPENLQTDEQQQQHFPLKVITSDYCYSSPTIREPLARIVSIRVKLTSLDLDAHAKDKLLRLVGDRYNDEDDTLTIVTDRCPSRNQNYDYAMYLLTALVHEARTVEEWEREKSEEDMEYYDWDTSRSKRAVAEILAWTNGQDGETVGDVDVDSIPHVDEYKKAVCDIRNNGESNDAYDRYSEAVRKLLSLN